MELIGFLAIFGSIIILIIVMMSSDIPILRQISIIVVIIFIIWLIGAIIEYIKEALIPSIAQATSSTMQATTRGLGDLYLLSIVLSTNRYFSTILISLICLILCLNIFKSKSGANSKIEIDSSNKRLKELLKNF